MRNHLILKAREHPQKSMGIPWELGTPWEEYVWERDWNHVTPLAATPCPVRHHATAAPVAVVLLHDVQTRVTSMLAACDAVTSLSHFLIQSLSNFVTTSDGLKSGGEDGETFYQNVN